MARPSKLAHVVYMTRRFDQMLAWYKDVFEATAHYESPALAFLTYDEEHHRFAFINMDAFDPDGKPGVMPTGVGLNHVGYTFENLGDLLETYERLKHGGITPYWRIHHGVTLSVYYQDPDGNRMEFQVDCYPDAAGANAFMQSETFAKNPAGVEIDPDELLARFRNGEKIETLMMRPDGEPSPIPHEHGLFA